MTTRALVVLVVGTIAEAVPASAQTAMWAEAGVGFGVVRGGGGPQGRLAFGLLAGRWGGVIRASAHDGARGISEFRFGGRPLESYREVSFLLVRSLRSEPNDPILLGVGIGRMSGRRIDPSDGVGMVDLDPTWGVPLELAIHGGDTRGLGLSLILSAHLNPEASQLGLGVAVSLGSVLGGAG
jgi:hypothetical protein